MSKRKTISCTQIGRQTNKPHTNIDFESLINYRMKHCLVYLYYGCSTYRRCITLGHSVYYTSNFSSPVALCVGLRCGAYLVDVQYHRLTFDVICFSILFFRWSERVYIKCHQQQNRSPPIIITHACHTIYSMGFFENTDSQLCMINVRYVCVQRLVVWLILGKRARLKSYGNLVVYRKSRRMHVVQAHAETK